MMSAPRRLDVGESVTSSGSYLPLLKHELLSFELEQHLTRAVQLALKVSSSRLALSKSLGRPATASEVGHALNMTTAVTEQGLDEIERQGAAARSAMIRSNMRLVVHIAKKHQSRGLNTPDLILEASTGLFKAIDRFDPSRGFRFSTYATWWIKQSICRALAEKSRLVRLPVHIHDLVVSMEVIQKRYAAVNGGRMPSAAEMADSLSLPLHKVETLLRCSQSIQSSDDTLADAMPGLRKASSSSMSSSSGSSGARLRSLSIPTPSSFHDQDSQLLAELKTTIPAVLTPRESTVLEMRFGLDGGGSRTLAEVGARFKVSRERIRQIESRALNTLRLHLLQTAPVLVDAGPQGVAIGRWRQDMNGKRLAIRMAAASAAAAAAAAAAASAASASAGAAVDATTGSVGVTTTSAAPQLVPVSQG